MSFLNPPIQEAIFDIRAKLPDETKLEDLFVLQEKIITGFPISQKNVELKGDVQVDLAASKILPDTISFSYNESGHIFKDANSQRIVQARLDGFTFSRVNTYKDWGRFYKEAYGLWKLYTEIANPEVVTQVGLRYINRIEIPFTPGETIQLEDYLATRIELPINLSVAVIEGFIRMAVTHKDYAPSFAVITQATQPLEERMQGYILPIIFDIDVSQQVFLNHEQDESVIRSIFESNLREFKNDIFFKSITKKTEELFQ